MSPLPRHSSSCLSSSRRLYPCATHRPLVPQSFTLPSLYRTIVELNYVALIPVFDVPEKETNLPIASFSTMKLPKGLTDDCDRPACDDTVSALTAALNRVQKQQLLLQQETKSKETTTKECPPTSAQLGRSTWDLLHSMAAWYPDQPSDDDKRFMTNFMASFARFYPCPWCAKDFSANLAKKPVQVDSRKDLSVWLCEQHNIVNQKLGKPVFPCDLKTLDERWRKSSDPKCQPDH